MGLNKDNLPHNMERDTWVHARNIVLTKKIGAKSNEDGCSLLFSVLTGSNRIIHGVIPLNKGKVIFSVTPSTGVGEIGIDREDGSGYQPRVISSAFNFSIDNPIEGVFQYNYLGELIITWWEGVSPTANSIRLMNFDNPPFDITAGYQVVQLDRIPLINLFPYFNQPNFEVTSVYTDGGNLICGAHQYVISYEISNNDYTNYSLPSNPVFIGSHEAENGYYGGMIYQNSYIDDHTSKSLNLRIKDVDTRYSFLKLVVLHTSNNITTAAEIGRFKITGTNLDILITGKTLNDLSVDEIIIPSTTFDKVESGTIVDKKLYVANYTTVDILDYQKYANNIKLKYTEQVTPVRNKYEIQEVFDQTFRSFMPDSVYAIYIHLIKKDGTVTDGFHIPGRISRSFTSTNFGTQNETDFYTGGFSTPPPKIYEIFDTSSSIDNTLGYHENYDEIYPDSTDFDIYNSTGLIGTLRNQNVRHHKFPFAQDNIVYGFDAEDIYFPPNILENISGYYFSFAKRDNPSNINVIGNSITLDNNFWKSDNEQGISILNQNVIAARFYDYSVLHTKPALTKTYLKYVNPLDKTDIYLRLNAVASYIPDNVTGTRPDNFEREEHLSLATDDDTTISPITPPSSLVPIQHGKKCTLHNITRNVFSSFYLQSLSITGKIFQTSIANNTATDIYGGDTFYCKRHFISMVDNKRIFNFIKGDYAIATGSGVLFREYSVISGSLIYVARIDLTASGDDATITFNQLDRGIYNDPASTVLCLSGRHNIRYRKENFEISSGDKFDGLNSLSIEIFKDGASVEKVGTLDFRIMSTIYNPNFGISAIDDIDAPWLITIYDTHSAYNLPYIRTDKGLEWHDYDYFPYVFDKSFNKLNDILPHFSKNVEVINTNEFPYTIARSNFFNTETQSIGWRKFLSNEYFEITRSKGVIKALRSIDKTLFIHHEFSLFIDRIKDKLGFDIEEIYLGKGDIFDRTPSDAVQSSDGYAGCKSKFSSIVCRYGLIFASEDQGKVFIFDGSLKEISKLGLRNFFKDNLQTLNGLGNPFNGEGITLGFDEDYNRLLITKLDNFNPFTLSFSFDINQWVCEHDYYPSLYFSTTKDKFQAISGNKVFQHNKSSVKCRYYDNVVHPSYYDLVFSVQEGVSVILSSVQWQNQIVNGNGDSIFNEPITKIVVYNNYQCSGDIVLQPTKFNGLGSNLTFREGTWVCNKFSDLVKNNDIAFIDDKGEFITSNISSTKSFMNKNKIIGKFVIVRFFSDNNRQLDVHIWKEDLLIRKSNR
jgi:hypothetical protein